VRILLVNPPRSSENAILQHAPEDARRYIHGKLAGPPLGLATLAAGLNGHDVALLDMKGEYDLWPDSPPPVTLLAEHIKRFRPDIVGVTVVTSEFPAAMELLDAAKRHHPGILTVAGGVHATLCPQHFANTSTDVVCMGQAVRTFRAIVEAHEKRQPFDAIGGIALQTPTGLHRTQGASLDEDGSFVAPDRIVLQRWVQAYRIVPQPGLSTYVFTSLGCPCRCSFCSVWPQFGGRYVPRTVESVVDELKTLDDYAAVRFADANTLGNLDFAEKLMDRIVEEGIHKTFAMDIRVDTIAANPAIIERLAKNGLRVVISGFESFRESDLRRYNKNTNVPLISEAVRVLNDNGIMIRAVYIIPPDYQLDDFRALSDFLGAHRAVFPAFTILTPIPGTVIYEETQDSIIDHDLARYNFFNCVTRTALPLDRFYEETAKLSLMRSGDRPL